jgi:type II secretory pathway predicted ATPase ExeA
VDLFGQLQRHVIEAYAAGRRVVLIFDEAQNLSRESLEELRMLTNVNSGKDELLQLVLVGQPELRDVVRQPGLRQFAQRVAANFHLTVMDAETVEAYIRHRVARAGGDPAIFTRAAARGIHTVTGGVPRLVNQLSDLALVYAFQDMRSTVEIGTLREIVNDGAFFGADEIDAGLADPPLRLVSRSDTDE